MGANFAHEVGPVDGTVVGEELEQNGTGGFDSAKTLALPLCLDHEVPPPRTRIGKRRSYVSWPWHLTTLHHGAFPSSLVWKVSVVLAGQIPLSRPH